MLAISNPDETAVLTTSRFELKAGVTTATLDYFLPFKCLLEPVRSCSFLILVFFQREDHVSLLTIFSVDLCDSCSAIFVLFEEVLTLIGGHCLINLS